MNLILLGPPGAGKGTQAKTLAKNLSVAHISTGDILRQNVADGTELGKQAKDFMSKGLLVTDELVIKMVGNRLGQADTKNGFILDGFPRTIAQAQALDKLLDERKLKIDYVIDLDTSEAVIIQRLSGRLACKGCNYNFHVKNMPPKVAGVCDNCSGELYQRVDDKEETIKKRLEVYRKESAPLIEFYAAKNNLQRVPADDEAGLVLERVIKLVEKR